VCLLAFVFLFFVVCFPFVCCVGVSFLCHLLPFCVLCWCLLLLLFIIVCTCNLQFHPFVHKCCNKKFKHCYPSYENCLKYPMNIIF
jgi:energy-coupling factor transporter transmembrane protein EcfT